MKLPRRQFLHLAASAAALSTASRIASALDYPSRPVRWIVGFAPGGGNDIVARCARRQCRSSEDQESPLGSAHLRMRALDWDLIRAEH